MSPGSRLAAAGVGAVAGASAWASFGVIAVLDETGGSRIGALPPAWALPLAAFAAALIVWLAGWSRERVWPLALTAVAWLPWWPGPVAPALLLWHGPLLGLVWIAALAGVAWDALAARPVRLAWPGDPRRGPWVAGALAGVLFAGGGAAVADRLPGGDEPHYLIITQSLAYDGDLRIENNHTQRDYASYFAGELRPDYLRRGADGQIYSIHAPGVSALVLPAFLAGGYAGVVLFLAVLMAVGTALVWDAAWRLTRDAGAAWMAWAAVTAAGPIYFHAFTVYPDGPGAVLVVVAAWLLVRLETGGPWPSRAGLVVAGAALALLPWLHTRFALLAGAAGVAVLLRMWSARRPWADAAAFLAVPVAAALGWFGSFWAIYGTPNPAAPYGGYTQSAIENIPRGVTGLLVDQQFGLLASAPVLAGALVGVWPLLGRHPRLLLELAAIAVPYALTASLYFMWWGGFSAPARFWVAALLPLGLLVACGWQHASRAVRAGMVVLLVLSAAAVAARSVVDGGALIYNTRDGYDLLLRWASAHVDLPLALPSVHRDGAARAWLDAAAWLAAGAIAVAVLEALPAFRTGGRGLRWLLATGATCVAIAVAASVTWSGQARPVVTPDASQLAFLREYEDASRPLGVALPALEWTGEVGWRRFAIAAPGRGGSSRPAELLLAADVPAGDYDIEVITGASASGVLTIGLGATPVAWTTVDLAAGAGDSVVVPLSLPVDVRSVQVTGDEAARRSVSAVTLRPRRLGGSPGLDEDGRARAATRAGTAGVFYLDEHAYGEREGFWTRGGAATRLVIVPETGSARVLALRNGGAPNVLTAIVGNETLTRELAPGETVDVPLGAGAVVPVTLETTAGFVPAEVEPGSTDLRRLGVWGVVR